MKKILIFQLRPEDATADNELEAIKRFGGLSDDMIERHRVEATGIPDLDLSRYAAIIVGGSPFDISTPESRKSQTQKDIEQDFKRLFDEIVPKDFPFLGACSGNGLLGHYLGATISTTYGEPVHGINVAITEEGKFDPLLIGLPEMFRALVGHKEACEDTPPGATLLVRGEACPVQMFRVGQNLYATQFHPEADPEGFTLRIQIYKHKGYFPPEDAEKLIDAVQKEVTPIPQEILRRFVERFSI